MRTRNIYKGCKKVPTVCGKCGAEWEMGTRKVGEICGNALRGPYAGCWYSCTGILKLKK